MMPNDFTVKFNPPPVMAAAPLAGATVSPKAAKPKAPPLAAEPAPEPDEVIVAAREYIKANEGVKNKPYKDTKGFWTVGIGHLMTPQEIKSMAGRTLSDQEVNDIFARDLASKAKMAKRELGKSYDTLPKEAKVAILDGFFRGDMSGSPKALELLRAGKLPEAADEYLNNKEYRESVAMNKRGEKHGVAGRMERNAAAIRAAANISKALKK
jgi:GH24 family phage-related lysozyme (muramidase)